MNKPVAISYYDDLLWTNNAKIQCEATDCEASIQRSASVWGFFGKRLLRASCIRYIALEGLQTHGWPAEVDGAPSSLRR